MNGDSEKPLFQQAQIEFAAHIRSPESNPAPEGIEDRRMNIYRNLFFNNIESFIANGFPILKSIIDPEQWTAMVRDFVHHHQSHSPYFLEIGTEFLHYLQNERDPGETDPAFMLELAHYEWVELALDTSTLEFPEVKVEGDLLADCPVVSPLAWPLSYNYQVQMIGPQYQPTADQAVPTHLIVYRNRAMQIGFLETNATTSRLLEIFRQENLSGREALLKLASELNHPNPQALLQFGLDLLLQLRSKDIICGFH
ncbi:MAG: DNA-binding domain-containing protein [Porticoccaceae bacterium]